MGNTITKNNDTLNWNNLKTDNFSDSLNNKYLSNDSKLLLSKLDINLSNILNNETDSIDNIFSKYQSQSQTVLNEINTTTSLDNKNSHELSETSPFISSEMYNYLVKKNQLDGNNNQKGGALNDNVLTDDSSTSETSESSESSESDSDKPKKPKPKKPKPKKPEPDSDYLSNSEEDEPESEEPESEEPESKKPESKKSKSKKSKSKKPKSKEYNSKYNSKYNSNSEELSKDSVSNNDNLSYVSSPGNSLNSTDSNSENLSGGSISNNNEYVPPSSINTSDINMISEAS
jgi:hypothetical protein